MTIPEYSAEALAVRSVFFRSINDVDIFVEDADQENLYYALLRRAFPSLRIDQIFPLGGKAAVLAHASNPANAGALHRAVHILDLDYDDVLGWMIVGQSIYYWPMYSVENLILDPDAIEGIAVALRPKVQRSRLCRELDVRVFLETVIEAVLPLFRAFAVAQRLALDCRTTGQSPEAFCSDASNLSVVDPAKVEAAISAIAAEAIAKGSVPSVAHFMSACRTVFPMRGNVGRRRVAGKFVLRLVNHRLRRVTKNVNVPMDTLVYLLAERCSLRPLDGLKRFLRSRGITVHRRVRRRR
jgi:hypothetical protein